MAKLRKASAYRVLERPYTRWSKYKKYSYVRARPVCRVTKFDMGDPRPKYDHVINLVSTKSLQIRDHALESARQTANRTIEKIAGKKGYHLQTRVYPHHVLRENPLASGAGADRMSTGMAHSFGKTIGIAAQVREGQTLFTLKVNKQHLQTALLALKKAGVKLPPKCRVLEQKIAVKPATV